MTYIKLRGSWCDVIVLNAHALNQDKSDEKKDAFRNCIVHSITSWSTV
jgi:hypothetical protein